MRRTGILPILFLNLACASSGLYAQWEWSLSVADEAGYWRPRRDSLFNPDTLFFQPQTATNHFLGSGRLSLKVNDGRLRLQVAGTQMLTRDQGVHARFLLREAYAVVNASSSWDFSIGKKLVKWGTGVAFNPSGFADPPKDARDPNDRLGLNQGTELVQANYVRGGSSFDVVYFAPRLFFTRGAIRSRDRLALRYNRLWRSLDFSAMALVASNAADKLGCNFSYVWGSSTELHGELVLSRPASQNKIRFLQDVGIIARPSPTDGEAALPNGVARVVAQSVVGGNYTFRNGWTVTGEWHHDGEGLGANENRLMYARLEADSAQAAAALRFPDPDAAPAFQRLAEAGRRLPAIRQNRDTLFIMGSTVWGHERFSLYGIGLTAVQDGSITLIPGFSADLHRNWRVYLRPIFFLGRRRSESGSQPYSSVLTLGLRYNL